MLNPILRVVGYGSIREQRRSQRLGEHCSSGPRMLPQECRASLTMCTASGSLRREGIACPTILSRRANYRNTMDAFCRVTHLTNQWTDAVLDLRRVARIISMLSLPTQLIEWPQITYAIVSETRRTHLPPSLPSPSYPTCSNAEEQWCVCRCTQDAQYEQAIGIALESRRLDRLEQVVTAAPDQIHLLAYSLDVCNRLVVSRDFRQEVGSKPEHGACI